MIDVDSESFLTVVVAAALAALIAGRCPTTFPLPVVVIEIVLGIVVGPELLGLAEPDDFLEFFSSLGLGMLFFFAGYEIDFERIRGSPLRLAALGWLLSLVLAYALGGLLALTGLVLSLLFTGSAMATTAIGTLIPILSDAGELRTRFGTYLLAAGALGEFGPILLITLVFSTKSATRQRADPAGLRRDHGGGGGGRGAGSRPRTGPRSSAPWRQADSSRSGWRWWRCSRSAALAATLGLDLLLGGFVAGVIVRLALKGREVAIFESKLTAVGYGFFIPFFFVVSGIKFDLSALTEDPMRLLELPLFLALFLVVRGVPALLLYRKALDGRERRALAFFSSTELPLVVAITTIAIDQGHMRASTAASLVGAAILSTTIFPLVGLRLRAGGEVSPAS